jgi:hypothetical protein
VIFLTFDVIQTDYAPYQSIRSEAKDEQTRLVHFPRMSRVRWNCCRYRHDSHGSMVKGYSNFGHEIRSPRTETMPLGALRKGAARCCLPRRGSGVTDPFLVDAGRRVRPRWPMASEPQYERYVPFMGRVRFESDPLFRPENPVKSSKTGLRKRIILV